MSRFAGHFLKLLGLLLITAAALKLHGWAVDPVRPTGWFAIPAVQFAIVLVEALLGVWFLTGWAKSAAWLVAFSLFTLFSVVSFRQGWIGEASCGCFGSLAVNPWLAFGVDAAALASFLFIRPSSTFNINWQESSNYAKQIGLGAACVACLLLLLSIAATFWFGSPSIALAYLRGQRIEITPQVVSVGLGEIGQSRDVQIELRTHTAKAIRVFGGTSDCSCVATQDLPITLAASSSALIQVTMKFTGQPGAFLRKAILRIDDDGRFQDLEFRIVGRTSAAPITEDRPQ